MDHQEQEMQTIHPESLETVTGRAAKDARSALSEDATMSLASTHHRPSQLERYDSEYRRRLNQIPGWKEEVTAREADINAARRNCSSLPAGYGLEGPRAQCLEEASKSYRERWAARDPEGRYPHPSSVRQHPYGYLPPQLRASAMPQIFGKQMPAWPESADPQPRYFPF